MSNFLQRLAAMVIRPEAKLRPMLGSIFAPTPFYSPAEPPAEISSPSIAAHHQPARAPRVDASNQPFVSPFPGTEDQLFPATPMEDFSHARFNPGPAADHQLLPAFRSPDEPRGPVHPHRFLDDSVFESSIPATTNQSAAPNPHQPTVANQSPAPGLQPRESLPTPVDVRAASQTAHRFQPAKREPDEIHIHIGRIEVAAVAEPAPRPAAAAARRSLNLDEYLRRVHGRPG